MTYCHWLKVVEMVEMVEFVEVVEMVEHASLQRRLVCDLFGSVHVGRRGWPRVPAA
jgi:hypothetical protein